ncbi:NepR family anti-sigma factor [Parvibaculum sp.]|uniref:NepR family anti-sigma factor n=1 Tax=Parvibaculum sp. TaxID=2024848 RepID=UPI0039195E49
MADDTERQAGPGKEMKDARSRVEQNARREALGMGLRRAYQKVLHEPIPEEFSALLSKLSEKDDGADKD